MSRNISDGGMSIIRNLRFKKQTYDPGKGGGKTPTLRDISAKRKCIHAKRKCLGGKFFRPQGEFRDSDVGASITPDICAELLCDN